VPKKYRIQEEEEIENQKEDIPQSPSEGCLAKVRNDETKFAQKFKFILVQDTLKRCSIETIIDIYTSRPLQSLGEIHLDIIQSISELLTYANYYPI
jgi:hypothetical protein